jgi:hypothetical protein
VASHRPPYPDSLIELMVSVALVLVLVLGDAARHPRLR